MAQLDSSGDVELAAPPEPPLRSNDPARSSAHILSKLWSTLTKASGQDCSSIAQINSHRPGYPRFTALLEAHPSFNIYRRFSAARARLLLAKQDHLSLLETQLEQVDSSEASDLFLGNLRRDLNPTRKQILADMDVALADYDNLVERSNRVLNLAAASPRDILSLQNWAAGTASLARDETAYLLKAGDLFSAAPATDDACAHIEPLLETLASRVYERFCKHPGLPLSRDPGVFVIANPLVKPISRFLLALLLVLLLIVPVAVVTAVESLEMRMLVISLSTLIVVLGLCGLTRVKMTKMFLCGAT